MNLKLYLVLLTITVSTILLLNSGAVSPASGIYKYDGKTFVQVPGTLGHIYVGADGSVWGN